MIACFIACFIAFSSSGQKSLAPLPLGQKRKLVLFRVCFFILFSLHIPTTNLTPFRNITKHVGNMSETCAKHVRNMSETCPKHRNMSETCPKHVRNMSETCLEHVGKICEHVQKVLGTCPEHVRKMSRTCLEHVWNLSQDMSCDPRTCLVIRTLLGIPRHVL